MNASRPSRQVKCPYCGQPALFAPENPYRPFCSERCRLIDLGQWADEEFRIPTQEGASVQDLGSDYESDSENDS
jgi:hypothetical protein